VLARYQGEDHRAVQAALKERAPLVPRLELLIAVGGSGSLGTALWSLLQGFVKETLK
jgi:putative intracellular protease/amidase